MGSYTSLIDQAMRELKLSLAEVHPDSANTLVEEIAKASSIAVYGVGREGLALKGFAMRLFHMGLKVGVVGEMTSIALGKGDLLIVSVGPGYFATVAALSQVATDAGAKVLAFTSQPPSPFQDFADLCLQIPAQCLAPTLPMDEDIDCGPTIRSRSSDGKESVLLLGSSYELALQCFLDIAAVLLTKKLNLTSSQLAHRHTNLE